MRPDIEHMSDEELQALSFDIVWGDEARLEMGARDMKRNVEAMSDTSKLLMDICRLIIDARIPIVKAIGVLESVKFSLLTDAMENVKLRERSKP